MSGYYLELLAAKTYIIKNNEGAIVSEAPLFKDDALKQLAKLNGVKEETPKKKASKPKKEKKVEKKEEKNDEQKERDMDD